MQRSIFVLCLRRVPFFRQALFHKERVSDGPLFPAAFLFLPPAGYFLSLLKESNPPEAKSQQKKHVLYAKVLLAESHPSEIKTKTTRRRQKANKKTGG